MSEFLKLEATEEEKQQSWNAGWYHAIPFLGWLTVMQFTDSYVLRTLIGTAILVACRPWRWYGRLKLSSILPALGVGIFILIIWVGMETDWMKEHAAPLAHWYERLFVGIIPFGKLRDLFDAGNGVMVPYDVCDVTDAAGMKLHRYHPAVTGWPVFWIHMFGTSISIAVIEEFFWRGFLYRIVAGTPFLKIDMGHFNKEAWIIGALMFATVHVEWLAAIICGLAYGLLIIKTKDIWAGVIAHATTNFLLGLYVLHTGHWQFW